MDRYDLLQIWELIKLRRRDASGAHYDAVNAHHGIINSDFELIQMKNGLVRTSGLYYAIAIDSENGSIHIYASRAQKYLKTKRNQWGVNQFMDEERDEKGNLIPNAFRYHIGRLPRGSTSDSIRDAIREHYKEFRKFSVNRMRLSGGRFTSLVSTARPNDKNAKLSEFPDKPKEVIAFSNTDFSLSVHEHDGGKWRLKMNAPYARFINKLSFVEVESLRTSIEWLNHFFTSRRSVAEFDNKGEALAHLFLMGNQRTQRTWRGQNANLMKEDWFSNLTTKIYSFGVIESKNEENYEEGEFDAGMTTATTALLGFKLITNLSFPKLIFTAVLSGFGMRKGLEAYKEAKKWLKWHRPNAPGIHAVDPLNGPYRLNHIDNGNRHLNAKPAVEKTPYLHVYDNDNEGCDITHDDTKQISQYEKHWKERWLTTFDSKAFGVLNSQIDNFTSTDISYNGLIRLSQRCPETSEIITYVRYVECLDINDKISIPDDIKALLKNGDILKISHTDKRKNFSQEVVKKQDVEDEVCQNLFKQQDITPEQDRELAKGHIAWIFNNNTQPLPVPAQKINQGRIYNSEKWTGKNKYIERIVRFFGDDWKEMQPNTHNKAREISQFFQQAVFPNVAPIIIPFMKPKKFEPPRIVGVTLPPPELKAA